MCSAQDNNLSDNEVIIIAVCGSVAGIIISKEMHCFQIVYYACIYFPVFLALIVVLLIRRQRIKSHYNATIMLKSYTVKPSIEDSNNHECFYPNPTYQDVQPDDNNINASPSPTNADAKQGDDIDVSPNPTFEDEDKKNENDNEFPIQLEN